MKGIRQTHSLLPCPAWNSGRMPPTRRDTSSGSLPLSKGSRADGIEGAEAWMLISSPRSVGVEAPLQAFPVFREVAALHHP